MTATEVVTIEDRINGLVQDLYREHPRQIRPNKGWIVVYVLPKEQMRNGIHLPDAQQHKPVYEGVVLATWTPWTEEKTVVSSTGHKVSKVIMHKSELENGQHILFEHWAGVPLDYDQKHGSNFRLVKEEWSHDMGGIFAVVERELPDPHTVLYSLLEEGAGGGAVKAALTASKIQERFLLIDKQSMSVTLSGRTA